MDTLNHRNSVIFAHPIGSRGDEGVNVVEMGDIRLEFTDNLSKFTIDIVVPKKSQSGTEGISNSSNISTVFAEEPNGVSTLSQ